MEMTNFEKYNKLHTEIMKKLENGEITIEKAKEVNDLAFDKYITEGITMNRLKKNLVYDKDNKKDDTIKYLGKKAADLLYKVDKNDTDKKNALRENPDDKKNIEDRHLKEQNRLWSEINKLSDEEYAAGEKIYKGRFHRDRIKKDRR